MRSTWRLPLTLAAEVWTTVAACDATLITSPGAGSGPTVVLQTRFATTAVTFSAVEAGFLHPDGWPNCCDFWCEMTRITHGSPARYKEIVGFGLDCLASSDHDLPRLRLGHRARRHYSLEYTLSDDQTNASMRSTSTKAASSSKTSRSPRQERTP